MPDERLVDLLGHADRRLRLEAQWELARRGRTAVLADVAEAAAAPLLARVHALQGLAQVHRRGAVDAATTLIKATDAEAWELRQVACRGLGETSAATPYRARIRRSLARRLDDDHLHVVATAAGALGRLGRDGADDSAAVAALIDLAAGSAGQDRTVRHAAAVGLAGTATGAELHGLMSHGSLAVRLVAAVALRRRSDAMIAALLDDDSPQVAVEAARAIHDLPLAAALPALAARAATGPADDAFLRRAVSAAEQVGTPEAADALVRVIARGDASAEARREAAAALGGWATPPRINRVTGSWLPDATARPTSPAGRLRLWSAT